MDDMLTTRQTSELIGRGWRLRRIRKMCERGYFPGAVRAGDRGHWKIPRASVEESLRRWTRGKRAQSVSESG